MKLQIGFLVALLVSAASVAAPKAPTATETLFKPLKIDSKSLTLDSFEEQAEGFYTVTLKFLILPLNSCEENYAGVFSQAENEYTVVSQTRHGSMCMQFAQPRTVSLWLPVRTGNTDQATVVLNGVPRKFQKKGSDLVLLP